MPARPRVLFVNHTAMMGGAEHVLESLILRLPFALGVVFLSNGPLVERLSRNGISALVLNAEENLFALGTETPFILRSWASRNLPRLIMRMARLACDYDLIYVISKKAVLSVILAAKMASRPFIWHQQDEMLKPDTLSLRNRTSETLILCLLNRYGSRVISASQACANSFIKSGGKANLPKVVHNGIDPGRFERCSHKASLKAVLGIPADVPLIGCFCRLTAWKGQKVLIKALCDVPETHLAIVGGPVLAEKGYETELRRQVTSLGLSSRVHFLGHRGDVPALMKSVDLVVHPSTQFDPCPLVVLETLHSGIPLIATAVGGVPELIEDGVSGLLVPPADHQALALAIRRILGNADLAAQFGASGRRRALQRFTVDRMAEAVAEEIRGCVADRCKK